MLEIIQKIIFEVTGKSEVTIDTDFVRDLELNSFDVMNIVCAFEDYFDPRCLETASGAGRDRICAAARNRGIAGWRQSRFTGMGRSALPPAGA